MPEDQQGAGAPANTTSTQDQQADAGALAVTNAEVTPAPAAASANKLIKDFAAQRGMTVDALLEQFTELENKGKTEFQRIEGERDTYKSDLEATRQELRDVRASSVVRDAATKAGAISPKAVYALIRGDIDFNKQGQPTNIDELIEAAKADEPQLFRAAQGSADGGAGGTAPTRDINSLIRSALKAG